MTYELEFKVRDYECDLQGIVNNSNYLRYFEHTRHEFIKNKLNLDFADLHSQGIDLVVYRVEIDYKLSLKSGDIFVSKLKTGKEGLLKTIFFQEIYRKKDNKLASKAKTTVVTVKNGRPVRPIILSTNKII